MDISTRGIAGASPIHMAAVENIAFRTRSASAGGLDVSKGASEPEVFIMCAMSPIGDRARIRASRRTAGCDSFRLCEGEKTWMFKRMSSL